MSFDIFLQGFRDGDAASGDSDAAMAVLAPFVTSGDDTGWRIATEDGEAEVYGGDPSRGFMFTHASGRRVWDVIYEVARAAGFVVIPGGCATCVVDSATIAHLPKGLPEPIVVTSGEQMIEIVESS